MTILSDYLRPITSAHTLACEITLTGAFEAKQLLLVCNSHLILGNALVVLTSQRSHRFTKIEKRLQHEKVNEDPLWKTSFHGTRW